MDPRLTELLALRKRDLWILTAGVLCLLAVLAGLGRLSGTGAGAAAGLMVLLTGSLIRFGGRAVNLETRPQINDIRPHAGAADQAVISAQRAVVAALSEPALIIGADRIQAFNPGAARLFSLSDGAVPAAASLRHPALLAALAQVQTGLEAVECEIIPARFPGQHWLARLTALGEPMTEPSQHQDVLIVLTDQAPVRKAERARADFLANASHELRTPLTSISGFIETMQGPARDDKDAWPRFIDIIAEQADHMRGLITDLLSLSRIELGEHDPPETMLDLRRTLSETLEALEHGAKNRGIELALDVVEQAGVESAFDILGAEGEVKQVIQNLVSNAVKYSPDQATVTIELKRAPANMVAKFARNWPDANRVTLLASANTASEGTFVWVSVRDQGAGIAPQYLPRLGERFFRVDASRGGPVEGTGLGLAIVKHIMAHHQGGFAVESIEGEGALFSVWFRAS